MELADQAASSFRTKRQFLRTNPRRAVIVNRLRAQEIAAEFDDRLRGAVKSTSYSFDTD